MIEHWLKYAAAFESAFESRNWAAVAKAYHPEATYDRNSDDPRLIIERITGQQKIVDNFENSLSFFDRRFRHRRIRNLSMASTDFAISSQFRLTYECPGVPDFELIGGEEYRFNADGIILSLKESFSPGIGAKFFDWMALHGDQLKPLG